MKKFIIRSLWFACIIAISLIAGEFIVRYMPNPYKTKNQVMNNSAEHVRTLILGNSHAYFGLRPDMMGPGAVNLANVSQTLKYDRRLFEHWLPRLDSLQILILHIGYTSLFDTDMEKSEENVFVCNYDLYMDLDIHPWYSRFKYEIGTFNTYKNKLGVFFGLQKSSLQHDSLGHGESYGRDNRPADWEDTGHLIAQRHSDGIHLNMKDANLAELERMLDTCRNHSIRVVFTTMPEWITYRRSVNKHDVNIFMSTLDSLSGSRGIPWFNYWADPRFDEIDFYDADHLNSDIGAAKFTKIIMEDIKKVYGDTIFGN